MANKFLEAHNLIQAYELNCNLSIYLLLLSLERRMIQFISIFLALVINFLVTETNQSFLRNNKESHKLGFPYQYFCEENLTDEEINYRLRLIYVLFRVSMSLPVAPSAAVLRSLPLPKPSIERKFLNRSSSQFKNFLQIALTFM